MKKMLSIVLISFILFSCKKSDSDLQNEQSEISQTKPPPEVQFEPLYVEGTFGNPCTGELLSYTGTRNLFTHAVGNENNIRVMIHINYQNYSAIGQITGDKYQITDVSNLSVHIPLPVVGDHTFTSIQIFKLVSQTSSQNLAVKATIHVTVNANLQVTASVDNVTYECI